METIKDILKDVIEGLKTKKAAKDEPEFLLKEVLPKKELGHVKFRYLRKGILGVTVDSSGWLYQLNLQKQGLLAKLGKKSKAIKDIRFYIGET
jgi:predicted nucleic acid-binding Zn ribbon protein